MPHRVIWWKAHVKQAITKDPGLPPHTRQVGLRCIRGKVVDKEAIYIYIYILAFRCIRGKVVDNKEALLVEEVRYELGILQITCPVAKHVGV